MKNVDEKRFGTSSQLPLQIIIPIASDEELQRYRRSLLRLLSKIEVNACDAEMKESVKGIYKLLSYLVSIKTFKTKSTAS